VVVGPERDLRADTVVLDTVVWADRPVAGMLSAQCSAHGTPRPATVRVGPDGAGRVEVRFAEPQRRVAPGQSVVLYEGDEVVGGGIALADQHPKDSP
jgi:tRNA-uridine 2-sulfurtransferase